MLFGWFLRQCRRKHSTSVRGPRRARPTVEQLESRVVLSITAVVDAAGILSVISDAADAIDVHAVAGEVKVNGADPDNGPFASAGVTALEITGTNPAGDNSIDLRGVLPSLFPSLTRIEVDGGGGDDVLAGPDVDKDWLILAEDGGELIGPALSPFDAFIFTRVESLVGGASKDSFVFSDGASLSGLIDGAGGLTRSSSMT